MSIANMLRCSLIAVTVVSVWVGSIQSTSADDTFRDFAQRINEANTALRNKEFDAAIAGYEAAEKIDNSREESVYNKAIALYRKGEVDMAESLFSSVASSLDSLLAAKARFNAGNCQFATAVQVRHQDIPAAIEHLQSAIEDYRSALSIAPSDEDARINIELAAKLLDQLELEQQQQQQERQQQNQDQESADQKSDDGQSADQHNPDQQNTDEQQSDEQQDSGRQSEPQSDQQPENANQQSDQSSQQRQAESASNDQQQQQSDTEKSDPSEQSEPSDQPANQQQAPEGELSAANETEQSDEKAGQNLIASADTEGEMTEQEARKMLQAIRDRDMLRRLRRQAAERSRHIPVDKDW